MADQQSNDSAPSEVARQLGEAISDVFTVEQITTGLGRGQAILLQGQLLTDSDQAYSHITARFSEWGYTPLMRQEAGSVRVTAIPVIFSAKPSRDI